MGCKHHPQHEQDGTKNIRIRKQRNTIRLCLGREIDTKEMVKILTKGIYIMISKRKSLLRYEPENGWGSYDSFLKFLIEYKEACEDNPGCVIEASR